MPELPDVEGFRRVIAEYAVGKKIWHVTVVDAGVLTNSTGSEFSRALHNRRIGEPARHGKWLLLHTVTGPTVLVHFGMTGSMHWCDSAEAAHPHDRVVFALDNGQLRYRDMRKLKGMRLAYSETETKVAIDKLGPDANSIGRDEYCRSLRGHRRGIKSALMDQYVLAGLGNLLVDEILWQARIPPSARTDQLDDRRLATLHDAMRCDAPRTTHLNSRRASAAEAIVADRRARPAVRQVSTLSH